MKALPEAVQRAFPCAPDRLPERPWWKLSGTGSAIFGQSWAHEAYFRTDGKVAYVPTPRNLLPMAEVDAAYPLPHPGYRAGQVWADDVGRSVVCASERGTFLSAAAAGPLSLDAAGYRYLMADPACPHLAPWSPTETK
jgi:hypothetical protein